LENKRDNRRDLAPKKFLFFCDHSGLSQNEPPESQIKPFWKTRLLLVRLLILVNGGLGNTVQIPLAALSDAAATLVLVVLKDTDLLEGLQDLTVDGARGVDMVGGAVAAVLGRAVDLAEAVDTDGLAEVDVTGDGGGADVVPIILVRWRCGFALMLYGIVPVGVLGRELVRGRGLDSVNPSGDGELSLALQERRVGRDELLRFHIANGDTTHFCRRLCWTWGESWRG
jgi:hypothetical protein